MFVSDHRMCIGKVSGKYNGKDQRLYLATTD